MKYSEIIQFIKKIYQNKSFVQLHAPVFTGNEKEYLNRCIDTTFVSSVGEFVDKFEMELAKFTGAEYAVVTVNGTSALHIALLLAGVQPKDEVLTQTFTFIATANAIAYSGASPLFLDIDKKDFGLSVEKLSEFLNANAIIRDDGNPYNKKTGNRIGACVPMHTFGFPSQIDALVEICDGWNIPVVEDAAESLGSYYQGKHTGLFGKLGILSFNGNKIITTGGGGAIITNDPELAKRAKHITTTAKLPHKWEFVHDEIGYNYRMPNINAAVGLAQLERINDFLSFKRDLARTYADFFSALDIGFLYAGEDNDRKPNYWLNAITLNDRRERDEFLEYSNAHGVMTRPAWTLMNKLNMFKNCLTGDLSNAEWLEDRVVSIPSGVILNSGK